MFKFENKPIVVYICFKPLGKTFLLEFIKSYKKFKSGLDHDLLICFKFFKNNEEIFDWKKNIDLDFIEYIDENKLNDYDIGSYFRIAEKYSNNHMLFLNTYTKINSNNWLKIFANHYNKQRILGAHGCFTSLPSQFFNFFYHDQSKIKQIYRGLKYLKDFKLFPNPHLRSNGIFLYSQNFLNLKLNRSKLENKNYCMQFESGRRSLSVQLIKKKFELMIVNSDNNCFPIDQWINSKTYGLDNQEKLIFVDNRTDQFNNVSNEKKKIWRKILWGLN